MIKIISAQHTHLRLSCVHYTASAWCSATYTHFLHSRVSCDRHGTFFCSWWGIKYVALKMMNWLSGHVVSSVDKTCSRCCRKVVCLQHSHHCHHRPSNGNGIRPVWNMIFRWAWRNFAHQCETLPIKDSVLSKRSDTVLRFGNIILPFRTVATHEVGTCFAIFVAPFCQQAASCDKWQLPRRTVTQHVFPDIFGG